VTGASGTIGRALCVPFAEAGWRVGVHYGQRVGEAEQTAADVKARGGHPLTFGADVRDPRQVDRMLRFFSSSWGRLDVVICNAGRARSDLVVRLTPDEWQEVIQTNLTGTFHCLRAAASTMIEAGGGAIVVIGSFAGYRGGAGQAAYAASKAGLLGLIKAAAQEWGPSRIRVNAVLPGWHKSAMSESAIPGEGRFHDHTVGTPPDLAGVAKTVYHLALSAETSGQVWNLDSRIL
jgi:3-oxoacyl-[acyl-carrier protein] reductase